MKHTKGEWKAKYRNGAGWEIYDKSDNMIASMGWYQFPTDNMNIEREEANAKLIAQAPDLLEACIHALEMCNEKVMPTENDLTIIAGRLKAAIKKATL